MVGLSVIATTDQYHVRTAGGLAILQDFAHNILNRPRFYSGLLFGLAHTQLIPSQPVKPQRVVNSLNLKNLSGAPYVERLLSCFQEYYVWNSIDRAGC